MNSPSALPDDPVLPHIARVLDTVAMSQVFADALSGHVTQLEGCRVDRVRYRPRRNCTISYQLHLRDRRTGVRFEQRVTARMDSRADSSRRHARAQRSNWLCSAAGPSLHAIPAMDMVTWWWPNDARLLAPRLLADGGALRERVLPGLVAALGVSGSALADHAVEIVHYVPERRLTAQVRLRWRLHGPSVEQLVYAKASRDADGCAAQANLRRLQRSPAWRAGRLRTPRALLWQPALGLGWQDGIPGRPLPELPAAQANSLAGALGAQLAALHGIPIESARTVRAPELRARLVVVTAVLAQALGAPAAVSHAAARLEQGLHWLRDAPAVTLHGDLHPRNVLAQGGRLALIDLDDLHRGAALLELGAWFSHAIYRALLEGASPMRDRLAWQALLDGYARAGGCVPAAPALAWATAWNLLTQRAWRCVVHLKPGRFAIAPALVDLAASLADVDGLERA